MDSVSYAAAAEADLVSHPFKIVVWDLDNTLWDGILLEDRVVTARPKVIEAIKALDERGVLHSIASRNHFDQADQQLEALGVKEYFVRPEICWDPKSECVARIANALNIGLVDFLFVDDDPFEREEVKSAHTAVQVCDADTLLDYLATSLSSFGTSTYEAKRRREMYVTDLVRAEFEGQHTGSKEEFLSSLQMRLTVESAETEDIDRLSELVSRTNQLNSTGVAYTREELMAFCRSPSYEVVVASFSDRFGGFGKVGLVVIEKGEQRWTIVLFAMSCRVLSRGVSTAVMREVIAAAQSRHVALAARFVDTGRNRPMYMSFKLSGFEPGSTTELYRTLRHDFAHIPDVNAHIAIDNVWRDEMGFGETSPAG